MSNHTVTTDNFATSSDEEIVAAAQKILREHDPKKLRPKYRAMLRPRFKDAVAAGTFLWAYLCKWNPKFLRT